MNRQQTIYEYLKEHIRQNGYAPSIREIAEAVGLKSVSSVHGHLERLDKKGLIKRKGYGAVRAIEITGHTSDVPSVLKEKHNKPTVINWQGNRYILDPNGEG